MRPALQMLAAFAAAAAFAIPTRAAGQSVPSAYTFIETRQEFGPWAGWADATTGRFGYGPKGGPMYGARYGIRLGGALGLEGVGGVIDGTRDVIDPDRAEGDRVVGEADVLLTMIDARLRLTATGDRAWHGLAPFLVLGGGVAFDLADPSEADELLQERDRFDFGVSFFTTLGAGARWFISDRFLLRADGSFSLWRFSTPPGYGDIDRQFGPVDDSEWERMLGFSTALLFRW